VENVKSCTLLTGITLFVILIYLGTIGQFLMLKPLMHFAIASQKDLNTCNQPLRHLQYPFQGIDATSQEYGASCRLRQDAIPQDQSCLWRIPQEELNDHK